MFRKVTQRKISLLRLVMSHAILPPRRVSLCWVMFGRLVKLGPVL